MVGIAHDPNRKKQSNYAAEQEAVSLPARALPFPTEEAFQVCGNEHNGQHDGPAH